MKVYSLILSFVITILVLYTFTFIVVPYLVNCYKQFKKLQTSDLGVWIWASLLSIQWLLINFKIYSETFLISCHRIFLSNLSFIQGTKWFQFLSKLIKKIGTNFTFSLIVSAFVLALGFTNKFEFFRFLEQVLFFNLRKFDWPNLDWVDYDELREFRKTGHWRHFLAAIQDHPYIFPILFFIDNLIWWFKYNYVFYSHYWRIQFSILKVKISSINFLELITVENIKNFFKTFLPQLIMVYKELFLDLKIICKLLLIEAKLTYYELLDYLRKIIKKIIKKIGVYKIGPSVDIPKKPWADSDWKTSSNPMDRREANVYETNKRMYEMRKFLKRHNLEFPGDGYIRPLVLKIYEILKYQYDKIPDFSLFSKFLCYMKSWWLYTVEKIGTWFGYCSWGFGWFTIMVDALFDMFGGVKSKSNAWYDLLKGFIASILKIPQVQLGVSIFALVTWFFAGTYMTCCSKVGLTPEGLEALRLMNELWPEAHIVNPAWFDPSYNVDSEKLSRLVEILNGLDVNTGKVLVTKTSGDSTEELAKKANDLLEKKELADKEFGKECKRRAAIFASILVVSVVVIIVLKQIGGGGGSGSGA